MNAIKNSDEYSAQLSVEDEKKRLEALIAQVLDSAKQHGATQADVEVGMSCGLAATARMGDIENIAFHREKSIAVTVYFGQKSGSASTTDTTIESLNNTVQAACNIAKYTAEDAYAGLADIECMAKQFRELSLYIPWRIKPQTAIDIAMHCDHYALGLDKRLVNSEGSTVSTVEAIRAYGNSHGFMATSAGSKHSISCTLISQADDEMQRDYDYSVARDADDLDAVETIARHAADNTLARLGSQKPKTTKAPVLMVPNVARALISTFISAIKGGNVYRKSTFLLDCIGQALMPSFIDIVDDPYLLKGFASCNYDAEGVQPSCRHLVKSGVLQSYLLSSYSARRLGLHTTGNAGGAHNVIVSHNVADRASLVRQMDTGLIVTETMGNGTNLVTGDYSQGASGYWVAGGEIQYPVHEVTIAGNLREMLRDIVGIAADVDPRGSILTGSILLENMTIAGA